MATSLHAAGGVPQHQLGGYILRQWLAQGGMAELYLATPADPARGNQIVVVKRVLPQFSQDPQFVRMFAREVHLASALKHPNIVEVFDARAETVDDCYLAMEYVHGPDLSGILRELKEKNTPMPLAHALTVAAGICAGLEHAHEHRDETGQLLGIVHRDVSPSNVMIAHDGTIKLMDFGVAKALALTSFTQAGTRKGKLSYMSPEQAVADPVDRRTDIFAIGAVLFEMTTAQRMLGGDNELAVMHKLLFRERPKPSEIRAGYPAELERIVLTAVAQDPANRFQTAAAMQQAIEQFARTNNIRLSATALAKWVATVIEPKPHPATDPNFYVAPTAPPAGETTVSEGLGPHTLAGLGALEDRTALDAPAPLQTAVGHMTANEPDSGVARPHQPLAPLGAVIVNPGTPPPAPVRPGGSVSAMPGPRTTAPSLGAMHSTTTGTAPRPAAGIGAIIGVAALIAISAVGAAVWYTSNKNTDPPPAETVPTPAALGHEAKGAAEPSRTQQPPLPQPDPAPAPVDPPAVAQDPTQVDAETPADPGLDPAPGTELAPADETLPPEPEADPEAVGQGEQAPPPEAGENPVDDGARRDKGKKKKEKKPKKGPDPVPEPKPDPKPVTEKTPPPPPPPPPRGQDKAPTDRLLPFGQ